jgi:hypothetical protein
MGTKGKRCFGDTPVTGHLKALLKSIRGQTRLPRERESEHLETDCEELAFYIYTYLYL